MVVSRYCHVVVATPQDRAVKYTNKLDWQVQDNVWALLCHRAMPCIAVAEHQSSKYAKHWVPDNKYTAFAVTKVAECARGPNWTVFIRACIIMKNHKTTK